MKIPAILVLASSLAGCVVAPIPEPVVYGPPRVVYAPPPPAVVVRPVPAYRYYGPRPYWRRWH
jgi:hypothetical protein